MTTILIWLGSGFAFSVGVFVGAALMRSLRRAENAAQTEMNKLNWQSVALSRARNLLDVDRNEFLEAIHFELQKMREAKGGDE